MSDLTLDRINEINRLYPLPSREPEPDEFDEIREKFSRDLDHADFLHDERIERGDK